MFQEYPKAMHGPDGGLAVVRDEAEEKALRSGDWIDGHEFWSAKVHAVEAVITAPIEAVENTLADACEAVSTEAESVAKRVRKPKKTAETPAN